MLKILIKKQNIIIPLLVLVVGFIFGVVVGNNNLSCSKDNYRHINPDLVCDERNIIEKHSYAKLKNDLENFIDQKTKEKEVTGVSVYFRDLQNGPTLGINEHTLFSPASLLKLPLLITYYNLENEEDEYKLFDERLTITNPEEKYLQNIKPRQSAKFGETYSVRHLLEYMIKYSDNSSYFALLNYLNKISPFRDPLKDTFVDLGIVDPKDVLDNTISVKSYGSIFVQLYNSSYFNKKEISEEILNTLSEIDYSEGLVAGVPSNLDIAHKFGERSNFAGNLGQLHDCGIIYYPDNPYLLCIMSRGSDFSKLPKIISTISKMVYEEFDSRKL